MELGIGSMGTVTEGFVFRSAAPAKSHAIPQFVSLAVGANERYPAAYPQRAAAILGWVLDHSDRLRKLWLNWFTRFLVHRDQTTRRAASHLPYKLLAYSFILTSFYLVPNLAVRIAKTRKCA